MPEPGAIAVVPIHGEVDLDTSADIAQTIQQALSPCPPVLVLDMTRVSFMSSTGLSILIATEHQTREAGVELRLAASQRAVLRPIQITGLTEVFDIYPTVVEAARIRPSRPPNREPYDAFIAQVMENLCVSRDQAALLSRAVLATLADRITGGEARKLADQLPARLATPLLPAQEAAEAFGFEEFARRTAERAGTERHEVIMAVDVVMTAVRDAVDPDEFDDVISQLPDDFKHLIPPKVSGDTTGETYG
jgi:anti-anti-sigma factor